MVLINNALLGILCGIIFSSAAIYSIKYAPIAPIGFILIIMLNITNFIIFY